MMSQAKLICPHCQQENRAGELICSHCHKPLSSELERRTQSIRLDPLEFATVAPSGTRYLAADEPIWLNVDNAQMPVRVVPRERTVLGRANPQTTQRPEVDLSAFKAFEKGVSTLHAALHRANIELRIMDLGSTNGTYLNGSRLHPHQEYLLQSGDELRLGNLRMIVHFGSKK
jgi:hypothetical protein